jgi:tetratricopeptide (TPR) repeat protein
LRRWLRSNPAADPAKLLRLGTECRDDLAWRAHRLLGKGRVEDAERIYELMIALWPSVRSKAILGLGACCQSRGDLAGALNQYGAVLALDPADAFALANRAEVHLLTRRPDCAIVDLGAARRAAAGVSVELEQRVERLWAIAERAAQDIGVEPRS